MREAGDVASGAVEKALFNIRTICWSKGAGVVKGGGRVAKVAPDSCVFNVKDTTSLVSKSTAPYGVSQDGVKIGKWTY
jgi:hypothetical protein